MRLADSFVKNLTILQDQDAKSQLIFAFYSRLFAMISIAQFDLVQNFSLDNDSVVEFDLKLANGLLVDSILCELTYFRRSHIV